MEKLLQCNFLETVTTYNMPCQRHICHRSCFDLCGDRTGDYSHSAGTCFKMNNKQITNQKEKPVDEYL